MSLLKRIPIHYKGELHDVRLINFLVPMDEVVNKLPTGIVARDFNGSAMISMVDVKLKNMRATAFPFIRFGYRHIAFRLLIDDSAHSGGSYKGIFFLKAFTNKPLIAFGGELMTDYNLGVANISEDSNEVTIRQAGNRVRYCLDGSDVEPNTELESSIGAIDRAYSVLGNTLRVTQIQREKWPIRLVNCTGFENTFFSSAKLVGAFRVMETIYYDWLPPKAVTT